MKLIDKVEYYTVTEVAKQVDRSVSTILNWYDAEQYAKENGIEFPEGLPKIHRDFDKKGTRYWTEKDIENIKQFRDSVVSGSLSFYSRKLWGERGRRIQENIDSKQDNNEDEVVCENGKKEIAD